MANQNLVEYIKTARKKGNSDIKIQNDLTNIGWNSKDIGDAFGLAGLGEDIKIDKPTAGTSSGPSKDMSLFDKAKKIFLHPVKFFKEIDSETGYGKPFIFYLIATVIISLLYFIVSIVSIAQNPMMSTLLPMMIGMLFLSTIISMGLSLAGVFFVVGLYHVGILIFGGRQGYYITFRTMCYSTFVAVPYIILYMILLFMSGLMTKIGNGGPSLGSTFASALVISIIGIGVMIAGTVHLLITAVNGIAIGHKISRLRAFFGIVFTPMVLSLVVLGITIGSIAYFGVFSPDKFLPERCSGPSGLDCLDKAVIGSSSVEFVLKNNLGFPITIDGVDSGRLDCINPKLDSLKVGGSQTTKISNGDTFVIKMGCSPIAKGRFRDDFIVSYMNDETGIQHTATITITGQAS